MGTRLPRALRRPGGTRATRMARRVRRTRGALRPVDLVLVGYAAATSLVAAVRAPARPGAGWLVLANGLVLLLAWLVNRPGLGVVGRTLREVYPLLLLPGLYAALDVLNGAGAGAVHDATVQRWELALFGSQVSRTWWQAAPSDFWSAVLHAAYLSYYLLVPIPVLWFGMRGDLASLRRVVLMVVATFVVCYLFFVFFPVAGPYYAFPRPSAEFLDNPAARLVYAALASGSSYGAAFPSSHVAASVAATAGAWIGSRRLGLALLVPSVLLTVSVVYCQMHYAVDAGAGVAVALAVVSWVRWLEGPRPERHPAAPVPHRKEAIR